MAEDIRYKQGGFEDRFRVTRTDGKPVRPEARYIVLDYANDPHARKAVLAYAHSLISSEENHDLAIDLIKATFDPSAFPAQHD